MEPINSINLLNHITRHLPTQESHGNPQKPPIQDRICNNKIKGTSVLVLFSLMVTHNMDVNSHHNHCFLSVGLFRFH